ncbi:MAG: AAA family ATPase, partial [Acidimicrobiia bacterium]|nr:AAA family ATPase [Acidimicrobiia bacterium]
EALNPLVGNVLDAAEFDEVVDLVERYLGGRNALFNDRIKNGWVRDGHGDLRAEHLYCTDDGPRLIDCLAFRRDFRVADVLNDVAFLAMDLHRLISPWAAAVLMRYYHEFTNEHHQATLAHHYVAYRAHVRAKIAAILLAQGEPTAAEEARRYHHLAWQHLDVGRVRLVLVGGKVGVGKSSVAERLARRLGATWLRTDEIRKTTALTGVDEKPSYDQAARDNVYREMLREAQALLSRGESVVMDATWSTERVRAWARDLAFQNEAELAELEVILPLDQAVERIVARVAGDDPSDATPEVAHELDKRFEVWPQAVSVDNSGSLPSAVAAAVEAVLGRRSEPGEALTMGRHASLIAGSQQGRVGVVVAGGADVLSYDSIRFYLRRSTNLIPPVPD